MPCNWISVKDHKPKKSNHYLVCGDGKYWISEWFILDGRFGGWIEPASNPIIEYWLPIKMDFSSKNPREALEV